MKPTTTASGVHSSLVESSGPSTSSSSTLAVPHNSSETQPAAGSGATGHFGSRPIAVECPVCLKEMAVPRVLSCGHSLCTDCAKKTMKRADAVASYTCVMCKLTMKTVRPALPVNFALRGNRANSEFLKRLGLRLHFQLPLRTEDVCWSCSTPPQPQEALPTHASAISAEQRYPYRTQCAVLRRAVSPLRSRAEST